MAWKEKLKEELKSLGMMMLYFSLWFAFMITMKMLLLREYNIEFSGISKALFGGLIVAKAILLIDRIPLGSWITKQPAIIDILFRTLLYSVGIVILLILEKANGLRHEAGGFFDAIPLVFKQADVNHIYVNSIGIIFALLVYNLLGLFGKYFGDGGFRKVLFSPLPTGANKSHN